MTDKPTLYHYYLPSENGEGWAEIVMGSNGFFAVVSDYGNYGHAWRHTGKRAIREFIAQIGHDYLRGKLDSAQHFDSDKTEANVRRRICERRRTREVSAYDARTAWDALSMTGNSELDYWDWYNAQGEVVDWDHELVATSPSCQILAFVEKTLPRLQEILKRELAEEEASVGVQS